MRLRDLFIFERQDAASLQEVDTAFGTLMNLLVAGHVKRSSSSMVKVSELPTTVVFNFDEPVNQIKAEIFPGTRSGKPMIVMYIPDAPREAELVNWLIDNSGRWRDAFVHEYVHYMDWKRAPGGTGSDAFESNASFQQTADAIRQRLSRKKLSTMDANSFYRYFVSVMREMGAPMEETNSLRKRVAQFYQDLLNSG